MLEQIYLAWNVPGSGNAHANSLWPLCPPTTSAKLEVNCGDERNSPPFFKNSMAQDGAL